MSVERLGGTWTIVLPLLDSDPNDPKAEALSEAHDFLDAELAKLAGGYTMQDSIRFWEDDFGKAFAEQSLVYIVSVDVGFNAIKELAERAAVIGHQQVVYIKDPENTGWLVRPEAKTDNPSPSEGANS
jgi:hypothetical protein